ncbi:MAG: hypothetical protein KGJ07_02815 [Patescibacteria group bacterium]|nr:hypothetical protein [Patescibacteria group bacterium]
MRFRILWVVVFFITFSSIFTCTSHAADQPPSLTVIPSLISLDLATDQPQADLLYKNNTDQTIELTLFASDFTQLEDGYKISFLSKKDAQNYQYSLSSWISFSNTTLIIDPYQTGKVSVFVDATKLSAGGHYATVLAQIATKKNTEKNLQIQGILSSLLFVRTHTGKEVEKGTIQTFSPEQDMFAFPKFMLLRFNNTGDTVLTPYGLITIQNMFGQHVTKGILNEDSLITLPETIRRYDVPLLQQASFLLPGWYTATIAMHFGKDNSKLIQQITFFSTGSIPLLPTVVIVVIVMIIALKYGKNIKALFEKKQ